MQSITANRDIVLFNNVSLIIRGDLQELSDSRQITIYITYIRTIVHILRALLITYRMSSIYNSELIKFNIYNNITLKI